MDTIIKIIRLFNIIEPLDETDGVIILSISKIFMWVTLVFFIMIMYGMMFGTIDAADSLGTIVGGIGSMAAASGNYAVRRIQQTKRKSNDSDSISK